MARQKYMEMLGLLMRMRIKCRGLARLYDSAELGTIKATLWWHQIDKDSGGTKPRFFDGDWMVDGWHHKLSRTTGWLTEVYLSRLDWDAKSANK